MAAAWLAPPVFFRCCHARVIRLSAPCGTVSALHRGTQFSQMRGLLHRHIPVRLINVSGSGFLLVCNERMAAGTTGVLRVSIDGTLRHSPVRVARSTSRPYGMDRFLVAGDFHTDDRQRPESLCGMVTGLAGMGERQMPPSVRPFWRRRWRRNNKPAPRVDCNSPLVS